MEKKGYKYEVPLVGTPKDYSDMSNWMVFEKNPKHDVDVFYLYPTAVDVRCTTEISEVDDTMKKNAMISYLKNASAFSDYTNEYAPYYRQISIIGGLKGKTADGLMNACRNSVVRTDVFAALDYFFGHVNGGKPYILASYSQGTANMKLVLSEYMRLHPEYLERMVACYAIGLNFPESWFKANPHIKKAEGECDTGVLINWNVEKPGCRKINMLLDNGDSFNINPLNWKTDETPASVEENLGSVEVGPDMVKKYIPGKADAVIDLKRGAVICSTTDDCLPDNELFGDGSFHLNDWSLYHMNIRENGKKRIDAFLKA